MANKFLSGLFGKKKTEEETVEAPSETEALHPAGEPAPPVSEQEAGPPPAPEPDPPAEHPAPAPEKKKGWLSRLRDGLSKSSDKLSEGVTAIFTKRKLDDDTIDELTDLLITADLGVPAATRITTALARDKFDKDITDEEVRTALASEVAATLAPLEKPLLIDGVKKPHVLLMVGVNGAGKTTTIGKLAKKFADDGKSVMLAAGDTFRAAAIEQLQVWGERTGAPVIARKAGADAAGLAFDAVKEAQEKGVDILMIDTAGRLQNRKELMDELAKIVRVVKKLDETAPHDVILTLDATVGQNALSQAKTFTEIAGVTGLVMTKLDGTARGGVLVALADTFKLPIHFIGVGEGVEDLQSFNADAFSKALAGTAA
ncbi:signal recognition particle-docking protein FtsY [Hyphococcus sp.]|uniref:signal recognition particle-docking protein FtsY n=1 Tax=Hyphococcus sp. TaxID=2038636 RepID=UPI0035C72AEC